MYTVNNFSFGYRFYYWDRFKDRDEVDDLQAPHTYCSLYVLSKFSSFKEEALNGLKNIDLYYDLMMKINKIYYKTNNNKTIKSNFMSPSYDLKEETLNTLSNINLYYQLILKIKKIYQNTNNNKKMKSNVDRFWKMHYGLTRDTPISQSHILSFVGK